MQKQSNKNLEKDLNSNYKVQKKKKASIQLIWTY